MTTKKTFELTFYQHYRKYQSLHESANKALAYCSDLERQELAYGTQLRDLRTGKRLSGNAFRNRIHQYENRPIENLENITRPRT